MSAIDAKQLYDWCAISAEQLEKHARLKIPFRIVKDSASMGETMAREFAEDIKAAYLEGRVYRAIVPCCPKSWYEPSRI